MKRFNSSKGSLPSSKNGAVDKSVPTTTFPNWYKLPAELKMMILSYCVDKHLNVTRHKKEISVTEHRNSVGPNKNKSQWSNIGPLLLSGNLELSKLARDVYYKSNVFNIFPEDESIYLGDMTPFTIPQSLAGIMQHLHLELFDERTSSPLGYLIESISSTAPPSNARSCLRGFTNLATLKISLVVSRQRDVFFWRRESEGQLSRYKALEERMIDMIKVLEDARPILQARKVEMDIVVWPENGASKFPIRPRGEFVIGVADGFTKKD